MSKFDRNCDPIVTMMIQMVDTPNTTPIGQDREILTFKALLYLNVAVYAPINVKLLGGGRA